MDKKLARIVTGKTDNISHKEISKAQKILNDPTLVENRKDELRRQYQNEARKPETRARKVAPVYSLETGMKIETKSYEDYRNEVVEIYRKFIEDSSKSIAGAKECAAKQASQKLREIRRQTNDERILRLIDSTEKGIF